MFLYHQQTTKMWASVLVLSGMLTACGGDGYDDDEPAPAPTSSPSPEVVFPNQDAAPTVLNLEDTGSIFVTDEGLSLYFFDNDPQGASTCNGVNGDIPGTTDDPTSCAGLWPPLLAGDNAQASGAFAFVQRDDGTQQWAYNGHALYTFANDVTQGDINGDGIQNVWYLARPVPVKTASVNEVPTLVGNLEILTAINTAGVYSPSRSENDAFDGLTLYTFDVDALDTPTCYPLGNGACIEAWPPLLADPGARPQAKFSVVDVEGEDFQQWAYNGKPLYFFADDAVPGDTNGQGINGVWYVATKEPAIFRTVEGEEDEVLSAVGRVETLLPESDSTESFIKTTLDKDQFTLYTFDNDDAFDSNCSAGCQVRWPPFLASTDDPDIGRLQKFERDDGEYQWAFSGKPLYFFQDDVEAKQTEGDGVNGVFHLVNPPLLTQFATEDSDLGETITVQGEVNVLIDDDVSRLDKTGFQLYVFDNDAQEDSNCTGDCSARWPALLATEDDVASAPFSIFIRDDDERRQWAVNGYPLYFYAPDLTAEDAAGEGAGNVWWVARPAPIRIFTHDTAGAILVGHGRTLRESQGNSAEALQDLTLYVFADDTENDVSTCFGGCASTWPPLYTGASDEAYGDYTVIERDEVGTTRLQWSYKGDPLYFYSGDDSVGDILGDYPGWSIARR